MYLQDNYCLPPYFQQKNYSSTISHNHFLNINLGMYQKYSSSQDYFYNREINLIIDQKPSPSYIKYQDYVIYDDNDDEFLRRYYHNNEYSKKLRGIYEYYRYQKNNIVFFDKSIQIPYMKWIQKKKKLQQKNLKKIFKEQFQSQKQITMASYKRQPLKNMTYLLKDISEYNPKSKKYYLRKNTLVTSQFKLLRDTTPTLLELARQLENIFDNNSYIDDLTNITQQSKYDSNITKEEINQNQEDLQVRKTQNYNFKKRIQNQSTKSSFRITFLKTDQQKIQPKNQKKNETSGLHRKKLIISNPASNEKIKFKFTKQINKKQQNLQQIQRPTTINSIRTQLRNRSTSDKIFTPASTQNLKRSEYFTARSQLQQNNIRLKFFQDATNKKNIITEKRSDTLQRKKQSKISFKKYEKNFILSNKNLLAQSKDMHFISANKLRNKNNKLEDQKMKVIMNFRLDKK